MTEVNVVLRRCSEMAIKRRVARHANRRARKIRTENNRLSLDRSQSRTQGRTRWRLLIIMHPPVINAVRPARTQHTMAVGVLDLANVPNIVLAANVITRCGIMKNAQIDRLDGAGVLDGKLLAARETFMANSIHSTRNGTKAT